MKKIMKLLELTKIQKQFLKMAKLLLVINLNIKLLKIFSLQMEMLDS